REAGHTIAVPIARGRPTAAARGDPVAVDRHRAGKRAGVAHGQIRAVRQRISIGDDQAAARHDRAPTERIRAAEDERATAAEVERRAPAAFGDRTAYR